MYYGCHPEGWCCIDVHCVRTDRCDVSNEALEMPLQLPRDQVTTGCRLDDVLGQPFSWTPEGPEKDINLMFFLLQEDVAKLEDEDLEPLVKLCSSMTLRLVFMSYKTSTKEINELMSQTRQQVQQLAEAFAIDTMLVSQSFVFASQPAWHVSVTNCWLPSVTHAWSKSATVLRFATEEGDMEIGPTRPQGIRGEWAQATEEQSLVARPLRWVGGLCEDQEMNSRWPPVVLPNDLSGTVALVARGKCSHYHKARAAQDLGAAAVVIFSHNEEPVAMSCAAPDPCEETITIPVVMITRSIGETLLEEMFPNSTATETSNEVVVSATFTPERQGPSMVGVLGSGGGLWYRSPIGLSRLADELRGMELRRSVLQRKEVLRRRESSEVFRVDVFQAADFRGGLTAKWSSEDAKRVREGGYTELDVELALDCEDHLDDNCPPWDHEMNLYLCIAGISDRPENCHDRRTSVARWVTPYGREALWFSNNSVAIPLLTSEEALGGRGTLHLHTWQHYTVSLTFWFRRNDGKKEQPLLAISQMPLWKGGLFDLNYNPSRPTVTFDVPTKTQQVILSALITGHGWGVDEDNCAEFCDHSHHFTVNGVTGPELTKTHPTAGNEDGCKTQVHLGVVPNQYGTWPYGRAGWCPGQQVEWWEVDVTKWLKDGSNSISYHAFFNGTDYDPTPGGLEDDLGFPAELHVASVLTFYGLEGSEAVKLHMAAPEVVYP